MSRALTMLQYAVSDLWQDKIATLMSICLLSVIMIPPCLMYAAKFGLIGAWTDNIAKDVANREVVVRGGKKTREFISSDEIEQLRSWPETGFVVPEPAFSVRSHSWAKTHPAGDIPPRSSFVEIGMRTTSGADPVFDGIRIPVGLNEVALSQKAAEELQVNTGDELSIVVTRETKQAVVERRIHSLRVVSELRGVDWPKSAVFVSPEFSRAVRAYQYFEIDQDDFPEAMDLSQAAWASVRIYAATIHDAPLLQQRLIQFGFNDTILHESQIATLVDVETGIDNGFGVILTLGFLGFVTSVYFIEWLGSERKSGDFGLLVIIGFGFRDVALLRLFQTLIVVSVSVILTILVTLGTQRVFDAIGAATLGLDSVKPVPLHFLGLGACIALVIGALGSIRASARMTVANLNAAVRED